MQINTLFSTLLVKLVSLCVNTNNNMEEYGFLHYKVPYHVAPFYAYIAPAGKPRFGILLIIHVFLWPHGDL